ncbi:hypothetical protein M501DRAFT_989717 [Patellaria atrata CBS 101060]|uniref:Yeast cell wall synthesis Kre9/Knh1-like N-terminal domain-containing protein n=1 Tax=Patellaria atrata CBS 101060 TaxID=1346257 RepID=A0A9P4SEY8_9PEZI|nr:hypothetical protein M501DRAFT_989717 [Patellaria atrata CBS 101060]
MGVYSGRTNIPNSGSYTWTPSSSLTENSGYALEISAGEVTNYSPFFTIQRGDDTVSNGSSSSSSSSSPPPPAETSTGRPSAPTPTPTAISSPRTSSIPVPTTTSVETSSIIESTEGRPQGTSQPVVDSTSASVDAATTEPVNSKAPSTTGQDSPDVTSIQTTSEAAAGTPTGSTEDTTPGSGGLSTGAKAGIGAGAAIGGIAALTGAFLWGRRGRKRENNREPEQDVARPAELHGNNSKEVQRATYRGHEMEGSPVAYRHRNPEGQVWEMETNANIPEMQYSPYRAELK